MRRQRLLSGTLAGLLVMGQFVWPAVAMADDATPSPSPTEVASPSPSPEPSVSPSPSPEPSADPSPSPSVSPDPSPTPSASPEASSEHKHKKSSSDSTTGADSGCHGPVPKWVFDTVGQIWVTADQGSFTCDVASGYYLSPKYVLDTRDGWYEIMPPAAPKPDYILAPPNVVHTVLGDLTVGSKDYQVAQALGLLSPTDGIITSGAGAGVATGTGTGAAAQGSATSNGQTWVDLTNLVNVINTLQSNAASGNVLASSNTTAGDVTTGAASVVANLINLLASAWSWSNGDLSFFVKSIGDFNKDITLDPTQTKVGGGGALGSGVNGSNDSNLNVNAQNGANIVNNVDLSAQSGNASANSNTAAGSVASGNAMAEVNIINLINSFIASGNSFFGILNIFGNFNGDILFPQGFLNGVVPSGTAGPVGTSGPTSPTGGQVDNTVRADVTNTTFNGVNNNIQTSAASGTVEADANTAAGNAQSGNASTANSLFNLSNESIFGDNAVLVMVNIMGHWIGQFMTLPGGGGTTQSALLTGNAQVTDRPLAAPNATAATHAGNNAQATVNQQSVGTITNNVKVAAQSGEASADKNTQVGNISSGNAQASSSVANIFNSVINASHWFGVLVINVFGNWVGDINHDSAAGGYSTRATADSAPGGTVSTHTTALLPPVGLLALVQPTGSVAGASTDSSVPENPAGPKVLTASAHLNPVSAAAAAKADGMNVMFLISAAIMVVAGMLLSIDKKLNRR